MTPLEIKFGNLRLIIQALSRSVETAGKPYEDWLQCQVQASVEGIEAGFRWSVMPLELVCFCAQIRDLHARYPAAGSAELLPVEPNLRLWMAVAQGGHTSGTFELAPDFASSLRVVGPLEFDQSYLPAIAKAIEEFVGEAETISW